MKNKASLLALLCALAVFAPELWAGASEDGRSTTEIELTPEEKAGIDAKKRSVQYHIHEQNELNELRTLLEEMVNQEQKKEVVNREFPFTPEEVRDLRELKRRLDRANNAPLSGPAKLEIRTVEVDVDSPVPLQLRVAPGYSSSIMFFDQAGRPWPVEGDIVGDENSFSSSTVPSKLHVGVFEVKRAFSESNALVNLKGLDVPLVIRLTGSDSLVDARLSVRIPMLGPDAEPSVFVNNEIDNADPNMLSVLNGDRLEGGKRFSLSGAPGSAWYKNGYLYVRSRAHLSVPFPEAYLGSPSGYFVYKLLPVVELNFFIDGELRYARVEAEYEAPIRPQRSIFDK